jgi:hypothetical protein
MAGSADIFGLLVRGRRAGPLLLFGGVIVIILALIPARHILDLQANGLRAQGVVESLQRAEGGSNSSYFPLVRFTTRDGALVRFRDASGSDPPAYRVDDRVAVLYAANDTGRAIIDRGPWNWLPVALLIAFGAVLCIAGVRLRQPATV